MEDRTVHDTVKAERALSADIGRPSSEREAYARLVEAMIGQAPWKDQLWARTALAIAARSIRRGRHLTEAEKIENLAKSMEEELDGDSAEDRAEGQRAAAKLRELIRQTDAG